MNTENENKTIILNNVLDMILDRNLITKDKYKDYEKSFTSKIQDDEYTVKTINNKIYNINFLKNIIKKQKILKIIEDNAKNYILIVMDPKIAKYFKDVKEFENVEVFSNFELLINPTKNIYLSQEHILLNEDEKNQLLKEYDCQLNNLPKILSDDPITKYYNAKINDVFKIIRNNPITNKQIVYRVVDYNTIN